MDFQYYFSITVCCISIPIGLFGNFMSILIFSGKSFSKQSGATYFIFDSILNIIILIQLPNQLMLTYWSNSDLACQISFGLMLITSETASWVTVLGSIDRLLAVVAPYKFGFKKNKKLQISLIAVMIFLIIIGNIPFPFMIKAFELPNNKTICYASYGEDVIWGYYYGLVVITLFKIVLPYFLMIISSVIIVKTIWKSKENIFNKRHHKKEKELTKSLVALDTFFIISSLPLLCNYYFNQTDLVLYCILYALTNLYHVFLFLLFIFVNKLYRGEFFNYMKKILFFFLND